MASKALSASLNTYVMGLRSLYIFYTFSAGIDFIRQLWVAVAIQRQICDNLNKMTWRENG